MKPLRRKITKAKGAMQGKVQNVLTPPAAELPQGRITNDTVAQHREQVLSAGRKFKYPLQHSKRKVVLISVAIVLGALFLFSIFCWWQLYRAQSTSVFMYRITRIVPVPVGRIDGQWVRYSDYLTDLRSSMHYLNTQGGTNFRTEDGKRQLKALKAQALTQQTQYALIQKIAGDRKIKVTTQEVDQQIQQIIDQQSGSLDVYKKVIKEYYDLTYDQWRESVRLQILRNRVYAAVDDKARGRADDAHQQLIGGTDFAALARAITDDTAHKESGGEIGVLEKGKANLAPELEKALFELKSSEISPVIPSKQGLFILKSIESTGTKVRAAVIFFQYTAFTEQLDSLQKDKKVKAFIPVTIDFKGTVEQQ